MSSSRRFHLCLPQDLDAGLQAFARSRGISLAVAIRELSAEGLANSADQRHAQPGDSPLVLATLLAAEHAVLMVASILPEGERRKRELAPQAADAAQERIRTVEVDAR